MNYQGPERRRSERIRKQFAVRMRKISGNVAGDWDLIFLRDVSRSGLSFHHHMPFREGDLVEMKISVGAQSNPIECRGEVVRVDSAGLTNAHEIAVVFIDMTSLDTERIQKTIDEVRFSG